MYKLKQEVIDYLKENKITNREIAKELGIGEDYISGIRNQKKLEISKLMAYGFTKVIDPEHEITDVFEIIKED